MNFTFVTLLQNFSNHAHIIIFLSDLSKKNFTIQTVNIKGLIEGCHITYFHHVNTIFWAKTVIVTLLHLCVTDHKTLSLFKKRENFKLSKVSNDET